MEKLRKAINIKGWQFIHFFNNGESQEVELKEGEEIPVELLTIRGNQLNIVDQMKEWHIKAAVREWLRNKGVVIAEDFTLQIIPKHHWCDID